MMNLCIALEEYKEDFATYPPSRIWWRAQAGTGQWPAGWPEGWSWSTERTEGALSMEGAECLVYFLGGGPNATGFEASSGVYGPYYDFPKEGLIDVDADSLRECADGSRRECAILYFKADRSRPGKEYDAGDNAAIVDAADAKPGEPGRNAQGAYFLSAKYQIISAGRDGRYHRAGDADPSADDVTNFVYSQN